MNQLFEKLADLAKKAQEPLHAIAELNARTLQNISYFKADQLSQIKKPEQFFEEQIKMGIENNRKIIDYAQQFQQISEKAMLSLVETVKDKTDIG